MYILSIVEVEGLNLPLCTFLTFNIYAIYLSFSHNAHTTSRHPPPPNQHILRYVPRKVVWCIFAFLYLMKTFARVLKSTTSFSNPLMLSLNEAPPLLIGFECSSPRLFFFSVSLMVSLSESPR